jgi:hypothetical protein
MVARSAAVASELQSTGIDKGAEAILKGAERAGIDERLGDLCSRCATVVLPDSSLDHLKIGYGYRSCHTASLAARNLNRATKRVNAQLFRKSRSHAHFRAILVARWLSVALGSVLIPARAAHVLRASSPKPRPIGRGDFRPPTETAVPSGLFFVARPSGYSSDKQVCCRIFQISCRTMKDMLGVETLTAGESVHGKMGTRTLGSGL